MDSRQALSAEQGFSAEGRIEGLGFDVLSPIHELRYHLVILRGQNRTGYIQKCTAVNQQRP